MKRQGRVERTTRETQVLVELDLDTPGQTTIETPLPFLSHMLEQIGRHGAMGLKVVASGDIEIDGHHTTEDIGIVFGEALSQALGDRAGIGRYGFQVLPMDEARVTCALDLSGRAFFTWQVPLPKAKLGTFDSELAEVFFEAVARSAKMNLHLELNHGHNLHHIIEICFKAFARSLRMATALDPSGLGVPSTKGMLV